MSNSSLFERRAKATGGGVGVQTQIFATKAENSEI